MKHSIKPHPMALSAEEIVKEDKLCLLKLVDGQLVSAEPSPKDLFYFIVTVNDRRRKKLYGTVGPDDTRVTYSYEEIGLPATSKDEWSATRCVMQLGIAKNVLKAHSGAASSAPK